MACHRLPMRDEQLADGTIDMLVMLIAMHFDHAQTWSPMALPPVSKQRFGHHQRGLNFPPKNVHVVTGLSGASGITASPTSGSGSEVAHGRHD